MKITWKKTNDYLYGTTDNFKFTKKLALFDLDDTLVVPTSKHKFSINENDWKWAYDSVSKKLRQLIDNDYSIIIVSNQAGIEKGHTNSDIWMSKVDNICNNLGIEMRFFCSTGHNKFRKPFPTFFHELIPRKVISNLDFDFTFFCGDCAGRKKDRTDTDYKFALNCLINFKTPEEVFEGKTCVLPKIDYPKLPEIDNNENILKNFIPINNEIIIMIGCQGSGKSFISNQIKNKFGYVVVNQDILKTKKKCFSLVNELISKKKNIIIDSTNPDKQSRKVWIDIANKNKYNIRAILMTTDNGVANHNNHYRHLVTGCKIVPKVAYNIFKSKYQEPKKSEGFSDIIKINSGAPEDFCYFYYLF